jgi:hypothetical protein|tara:strand:+ start:295 stop:882 length:588 start_codon:yes stop_codon:yes gene_type:complete
MAQKTNSLLKTKISRQYHDLADSTLNLTDGGTIAGATTLSGQTIIHQDFAIASGSATGDNAFAGNAGTLTEAAHAGKVVLLPDATANATLRIPTPSKAGICYKLVYHGVADDAHDLVISFADDECYFKGSLMTQDEDEAGAAQVATIFGDGSTTDVLTINDPHTFEINLVSLSTTQMAVWGYVVSDTVAAFSAAD